MRFKKGMRVEVREAEGDPSWYNTVTVYAVEDDGFHATNGQWFPFDDQYTYSLIGAVT